MQGPRLWKFAFLAAGLALLPAPAGALITVGSLDLPSAGTAVVVEDGLAYIGARGGIFIVDVCNPSAPVEIGAIGWPHDPSITIRDVVVEGGLAYLAVEISPVYPSRQLTGSLWIVDVSDPTAPIEIGVFEVPLAPTEIAVVDDLAYLTVYAIPPLLPGPPPYPEIESSGMRVIDVANPSAPVQVGNIEFSDIPHEIEVLGDLAYIACSDGLRTVDVSDPTAPVEIDLIATYGGARSLTIVGGLAYVTGGARGNDFSVFDLSDPRTPIEIGYLQLPHSAYDVAVEGETAYVRVRYTGLQAIDVSDPEAPFPLGRLATPGDAATALTTANGLAYVLEGGGSFGILIIIDLSIPTTPVEVGTTTVSGFFYDPEVAVVGDLAYITVGEEGIRVIDVSNPATPVEISAIDTAGFAAGVAVVGHIAYVADGEAGLRIIDFAKPTAPVEISAIDTPGFARAVEVVSGLAYVADDDSGLRVIDVSNPEAPVEIGSVDTFDALDVAVVGELAYVADFYEGLKIIDVSNPEQPVEIGALNPPGLTRDIAVSGGWAYLADDSEGLRIIDVSDPKQPIEIGAFTSFGDAYAVAVVGEIAYLGADNVVAVDISDPTTPVEVGGFNTSNSYYEVFDLVVAEGLVYAIRLELVPYPDPILTKLIIIDFGPEYAPKIEISIDVKPNINPASRGVVPVAILGSETFDIADIDLATLTFGPSGATPAHSRGGHPANTDGDGATDLVSHFWVQETGITSETERVCVSGKMLDGTAFGGCGAI